MSAEDPLLHLLGRFHQEGVEYVLVGGQAVRLNGYVRATEDIDVLVKASRDNGERVIRALDFLKASEELNADWFLPPDDGTVENIRVADEVKEPEHPALHQPGATFVTLKRPSTFSRDHSPSSMVE